MEGMVIWRNRTEVASQNQDKKRLSGRRQRKETKKILLEYDTMKTKSMLIVVLFAAILIGSFYIVLSDANKEVLLNGKSVSIPKGNTHWHPKLTIMIDGQQVPLPDDIGSGTGRVVDTYLSGMRMSPTHTHESDGTIHIENKNPAKKPETLTLGYFFYVWDKPFSSDCIFDYCTTGGVLKMYVNGEENQEYGDYIMHDGDDIVIEYTSHGGLTDENSTA